MTYLTIQGRWFTPGHREMAWEKVRDLTELDFHRCMEIDGLLRDFKLPKLNRLRILSLYSDMELEELANLLYRFKGLESLVMIMDTLNDVTEATLEMFTHAIYHHKDTPERLILRASAFKFDDRFGDNESVDIAASSCSRLTTLDLRFHPHSFFFCGSR